MNSPRKSLCCPLLFLLASSLPGMAAVTFVPSFTDDANANLSEVEKGYFNDGLAFWSSIISGYQDGVDRTYTLTVDAFDEAPSNGTITLGSAGPRTGQFTQVVPGANTSDGRYFVALTGITSFNVNPAAGTLNPLVVRHEIGHAIGIGTLWEVNEVYNDGDPNNNIAGRTATVGSPGQYVGIYGLAAYRTEYDPTALFIPVELDGGGGTADGHWNEVADNPNSENQAGFDTDPGDGSAAPTVLLGANAGESLDDELMTGFLSGSGYLSDTTIQSLRDLGFTIATPVPEPTSMLMIAIGSIALTFRRKA